MKNIFVLLLIVATFTQAQKPYPSATRVHIAPAQVFDITQARKTPQRLFDGDITTPALPDFFNGFILRETNGQVAWIVLDSFINHPKIEVFNTQFSSGGIVDFQFFYNWTDTTRHSPVYSTTLPSNAWKWVDTVQSRAYADSARLIKLRIADGGSTNFTEVRIYAYKLGAAPSIYPPAAAPPPDEGKYFMGYGKLYTDTLLDDAGYSQRLQSDMDYIDTASRFSDGKTIVLNKYNNSIATTYLPATRNGRRVFPYYAGPRRAFKYPPHYNNDSKDMPPGADSTDLQAWQAVYNTYYGLAAKLGHNKKASLKGYTFRNAVPGAGLGLIEEIEIGNEDDARWAGNLRFHNPLVKLIKLKQGYAGAKAADPGIRVISGAITGIDTSYLKAMYLCHLLRFGSKQLPFDAIAINEYATSAGGQHGAGSRGISPEQFSMYEKLKGFIDFRNRYFPGKPVYLTEFGYDVHNGSNYHVPDIKGQTREHTKACWLLRAMELTAAAQWSKFYQYSQRNVAGGDFSTTGFSYDTSLGIGGKQLPAHLHAFMNNNILNNGGWLSLPKELYWHMTMRAGILENYNAWPEVIRNGDSTGVWILKYTHRSHSDSIVYSIWMGTHSNASVKNYSIPAKQVQSATITRAAIGKKAGDSSPAVINKDGIVVPVVDESVRYIVVKKTTM